MLSLRTVILTTLTAALLSSCASTDDHVKHGMAPSSTGPKPDWYVKEFGLPRGVGEALRRDNLSLWDQASETYTYTIRGEIYAQFHPWEHFLKIKLDTANQTKAFADECKWSANGTLNNLKPEELNPKVSEQCDKLINQLAQELDLVTE